jgi:SAM-dependent methyltransferase
MRQAAVNLMRKSVDGLGRRPALQKPFFWLTFLNVRLAYPLQYLILRELIACDSVLDLGCGRHSMVPIIPKRVKTVGVELFEPHYKEAAAKARHTEVIQGDVTKVSFPDKSFDAVVMLDVLEHLDKPEGEAMLAKMERWARKKIVIFTPNGFLHQGEYDTNPLMAHRSGWTAAEFRAKGWRVHGVRGFKSLKPDCGHHHHDEDEHKESLKDKLVDLTQVVTYHWPDQAFQLFCVKDLEAR